MAQYVDPAELRTEMQNFVDCGVMSTRLALIIHEIGRAVASTYARDGTESEVDDVAQELVIVVLRHRTRINPDANVFSFLSECGRNILFRIGNKMARAKPFTDCHGTPYRSRQNNKNYEDKTGLENMFFNCKHF
jgi:hypothetical protein